METIETNQADCWDFTDTNGFLRLWRSIRIETPNSFFRFQLLQKRILRRTISSWVLALRLIRTTSRTIWVQFQQQNQQRISLRMSWMIRSSSSLSCMDRRRRRARCITSRECRRVKLFSRWLFRIVCMCLAIKRWFQRKRSAVTIITAITRRSNLCCY